MEYRQRVISFLEANGLKTEANTEIVNSLRSKQEKSWDWIYLALDESSVENWRKYGLALMRKPDFQARVDEKLEAQRRRIEANSNLTVEQLNPPITTIMVKPAWDPWLAALNESQTRFIQTKEGVFDNELGCVIWFHHDYDYSRYIEDCELGNIRYGGEPSPEALGYAKPRSHACGKRVKMFDLR